MSRAVVLVACIGALVSCRPAGQTTERPLVPLDETVATASANVLPPIELPSTDELQAVEGSPPPSRPTGEPVQLAYVAPRPDASRVRTLTIVSSETRDTVRQISRYGYRLTEVASQLDRDKIAVLRITAHDARESIELDGKTNEQKLLWGTYDVDLTNKLSATRDRRAVSTREQEEIAVVFGFDDGNESGTHQIARTHPLRVGESITLTDGEKEV